MDYQLFYSQEDARLKIQKRIEGIWHTYLPPEGIKDYPTKALVDDQHHWLAKTTEGKAHIHIERQNSEQPVATAHLTETVQDNPDGPYAIETIIKIDPEHTDHQVLLKDIYHPHTPFEQLFTFQPKDQILLWGSQQADKLENQTLEFPKLNIDFHFNDQGHAVYSADDKYKIAERQSPPAALSEFSGFLKIEAKGQKKYLVPKEPLSLTAATKGRLKTDKKTDNTNAFHSIAGERRSKCQSRRTQPPYPN